MSISTTRKDPALKIDNLPSKPVSQKIIEKTAKKIGQDFFGTLAAFAVLISGIGFLFGRKPTLFWGFLTLALVIGVFYEKFFSPKEIIITGETKKSNLPK